MIVAASTTLLADSRSGRRVVLIMRPAHIHRHRPVRPAARHRVHTQLGRLPPASRAGTCHHKHILTPGDESVSPNWTFCTQHAIHPGLWAEIVHMGLFGGVQGLPVCGGVVE